MLCKFCKNEIPDGSIFCNWCGERQIKERKKKDDISVPKPRQLGSGRWTIQLRAEGQSVTEDTADLCIAKATAIRAGFVAHKKKQPNKTLSSAIDDYIESRKNILSPSTVRGYRVMQNNRIQDTMKRSLYDEIDWQMVIDQESLTCSPKTVKNLWRFVSTILRQNGIIPPKIMLPQLYDNDLPWLDHKQILDFCDAINGKSFEMAALMALSSLRRSELLAVTQSDIAKDCKSITVHGSKVQDEDDLYIIKDTNKNKYSRRTVPVLIPRLEELLKNRDTSSEYLITSHPNTLRKQINNLCERSGLPKVGVHGLRRSFVSLGHYLGIGEEEIMKIGGWRHYQTVHKHYLFLSEDGMKKSTDKIEKFYRKNSTKNK